VTRRLVLVVALALVGAPAALGHAFPLTTSPLNGAVLTTAPTEISVTFDSAVRPGPRNAVVSAGGVSVLAGRPAIVSNRTLLLPLHGRLVHGSYAARWSVVSEDGHEEEGLIAFAVGSGNAVAPPALSLHGTVTWQRVIMRLLFLLGVLGAAGAAFFAFAARGALRNDRRLHRREAEVLGMFLVLAFLGSDALLHAADTGGTRFGHVMTFATVVAGVGAIAAWASRLLPRLRVLATLAALALLPCPTLAGHALDASQPRLLSITSDLLHVAGAAVWIGGLAALVWVTRRTPMVVRSAAVRRFSAIAVPAVITAAAGGAARALTELASVHQLWSTGYGQALLVKSGLFVALLGLAFANRGLVSRGVGRLATVELLLLAVAVTTVGVLTDLKPGRGVSIAATVTPSNVPPPPLPPARGAFVDATQAGPYAVAIATKGRVVTVTVVASDGGGALGVDVSINGKRPEGCGRGCFRATVSTRRIGVVVAGVAHTFAVPAHPRPAAAALRRAARVFDALRSVTIAEELRSAPGKETDTLYREVAPDRLAYRIVKSEQANVAGIAAVAIGHRRWTHRPGTSGWVKTSQPEPLDLPHAWWSPSSRNAFVTNDGSITFFDPIIPAWFRIRVDARTGRVTELRMVAAAHFMVHRYSGFDSSGPISPPVAR